MSKGFDMGLFRGVAGDALEAGPEQVPGVLDGLARAALRDLSEGGEFAPLVLLVGRGGRPHLVTGRVADEEEEKDLSMEVWLRGMECAARALFSVTHSVGFRVDDAERRAREYLVVSASLRDEEGDVRCWAAMTELPLAEGADPAPVQEVTESLKANGSLGGPSLYALPDFLPTGADRADARRRLERADKRRAKGKPPFAEGFRSRVGWREGEP